MASKFVDAVNVNGTKQRVPAAWLAEGSPFAEAFRLPPSARVEPEPQPAEQADSPVEETY